MAAMLATMMAVWLVILLAPATPIGRWLHALLVVRPAARLDRLTRGHVALVLLITLAIAAVAWAGEGDGVRMLTMAAPEAATWLTTFEVAAYLDVAIAALAAWSATRLRLPFLSTALRKPRPRRRAIRSTRPAAANDDDPDRRGRIATSG